MQRVAAAAALSVVVCSELVIPISSCSHSFPTSGFTTPQRRTESGSVPSSAVRTVRDQEEVWRERGGEGAE